MFAKPISNIRISSDSLEQVLNDVIESIAEEEIALSKILDFEGEIIQEAKKGARNIKDFVSVNESVNSIIENVIRLQKLTQVKLEFADELLQIIRNYNECDED